MPFFFCDACPQGCFARVPCPASSFDGAALRFTAMMLCCCQAVRPVLLKRYFFALGFCSGVYYSCCVASLCLGFFFCGLTRCRQHARPFCLFVGLRVLNAPRAFGSICCVCSIFGYPSHRPCVRSDHVSYHSFCCLRRASFFPRPC